MVEGTFFHQTRCRMEDEVRSASRRAYPGDVKLNSWQHTGAVIKCIARALELPTTAALENTHQMINGKLSETSKDPMDVQVVQTETEMELVYYCYCCFSVFSLLVSSLELMARCSHLPSDPAYLLEYTEEDLAVESDSDREFDSYRSIQRKISFYCYGHSHGHLQLTDPEVCKQPCVTEYGRLKPYAHMDVDSGTIGAKYMYIL